MHSYVYHKRADEDIYICLMQGLKLARYRWSVAYLKCKAGLDIIYLFILPLQIRTEDIFFFYWRWLNVHMSELKEWVESLTYEWLRFKIIIMDQFNGTIQRTFSEWKWMCWFIFILFILFIYLFMFLIICIDRTLTFATL